MARIKINNETLDNLFVGYVEKSDLLKLPHVALYLYLASLAARGKTYSVPELSKLMDEPEEKIIERLDRLSDCMLIENRADYEERIRGN